MLVGSKTWQLQGEEKFDGEITWGSTWQQSRANQMAFLAALDSQSLRENLNSRSIYIDSTVEVYTES